MAQNGKGRGRGVHETSTVSPSVTCWRFAGVTMVKAGGRVTRESGAFSACWRLNATT